jgi:hypothetical protein
MVRHGTSQIEAAEPAVREVQMHLLAETPLRADAEAIPDDQRADHQLRVDRGAPGRAVERGEIAADAGEVDEAVDGADQMAGGDMILEAEFVEQARLRQPPFERRLGEGATRPESCSPTSGRALSIRKR